MSSKTSSSASSLRPDGGVLLGPSSRHGARAPIPADWDGRRRAAWRWPRRLSFTRDGKYFVALSFGIGLAAINTGNNLLYLLLGMMLSFIVASGVLSEVSLRGLAVERHPPAYVFAGRPFLMGVSLRNRKRRLPSFSIEIEDLVADRPLDKKCYFLKIPAGRTQQTSYRHTFSRRGSYRFTGFRVATRFPFALFRKSLPVDHASELVVFPAVRPVPAPSGTGGAATFDGGGQLGRLGEFHGLRPLREGDDPRDIHWRSSARAGRLLVREREEQSERYAVLRLDNAVRRDASGRVAPSDGDALERVIETAASLAAEYISRGYAVRVVARGAAISAGTGSAHLLRVLRFLALLPAAREHDPFPAEVPGGPPGAVSVLVADEQPYPVL